MFDMKNMQNCVNLLEERKKKRFLIRKQELAKKKKFKKFIRRLNKKPKKAKRPKRQKPPPGLVKIDLYDEQHKAQWLEVRYKAFRRYGRKCALCGATNKALHVDHIKPKSMFPKLVFDINNLQILCEDCNLGKGYRYHDDWRQEVPAEDIKGKSIGSCEELNFKIGF